MLGTTSTDKMGERMVGENWMKAREARISKRNWERLQTKIRFIDWPGYVWGTKGSFLGNEITKQAKGLYFFIVKQ